MNLDQIQERVVKIEQLKMDPKAAHSEEDKLRNHFLLSLVENPDTPIWIRVEANAVLQTNSLNFPRI